MLGEPPRTQFDLNFSLWGIPVRIHPLFWLAALVLNRGLRDMPAVLSWIAAVFLAILVHELGHALVMRVYGFRPWIVLYLMGGLTLHGPRDVPRAKSPGPWTEILISLAGPAAGFLLTALVVLGFVAAGYRDHVRFIGPGGLTPAVLLRNEHVAMFLYYVFHVCVLWGLINLLPIYPLDGGHVAREIMLRFSPRDGIRQSMLLSMSAAAAMAAFGLLRWNDVYVAMLFGYLAFSSYVALQAYGGRSPW
jgi:stage IV sporulation protein FB